MLQRVAVWCSVLQYAAACCSVLQRVYVFTYTYTHTFIYPCHPLYDKFMCICISKYIYTLQHTATRCNRLQHTATRCNTYTHVIHYMTNVCVYVYVNTYTRCNTPQHAATYCNTHCNTLQHVYPGHSLYVCPRGKGQCPFLDRVSEKAMSRPFQESPCVAASGSVLQCVPFEKGARPLPFEKSTCLTLRVSKVPV